MLIPESIRVMHEEWVTNMEIRTTSTVETGLWRAIALVMLLVGLALLPAAAGVLADSEATPAVGVPVVATPAVETPSADMAAEWPLYGQDLAGAKATERTGLTAAHVGNLAPSWAATVGGSVRATPIIAGGVGYVGSYDGDLYAIDLASGTAVWTYETGTVVLEPNLQIELGITGSAAWDDGVV